VWWGWLAWLGWLGGLPGWAAWAGWLGWLGWLAGWLGWLGWLSGWPSTQWMFQIQIKTRFCESDVSKALFFSQWFENVLKDYSL